MMLSNRPFHISTVILLVCAIAMMTLVPISAAQDTTTQELIGTLEHIDGSAVIVSGQSISIIGAEINDPLIIGALVKVHAIMVDGALVAREIELAIRDDDNSNTNANTNANDNSNTNGNSNGNGNSNDNTGIVATVTAQEALATVLQVYPTTQIRSIRLTTRFGGTAVWEIRISGRIEVVIDAQTGDILVIDRGSDDDNQNANINGNSNDNDDGDDNGNSNGNENGNDNESGDDDDGGMGGMG